MKAAEHVEPGTQDVRRDPERAVKRAQHTVGAAALNRGRCEGCHLSLNTVDLGRIRAAPPDEVLRCEECRRILVRTDELSA